MIAYGSRRCRSRRATPLRAAFAMLTLVLAGPGASPPGPRVAGGVETRDRLVLLKPAKGAGKAVVALARPTMPTLADGPEAGDLGLLVRELIRQSVLIAARDELGLATRDEVLDDLPVAATGGTAATLSWRFPGEGESRVRFTRGEAGEAGGVILADARLGVGTAGFLTKLVDRAERLSRSEFPAALKALGAAGTANKVKADAALPAKVEARLASLGFVENLAAVRDLHAAIRDEGESPARLAALARGYAQLGVLSQYQWSPAHKAFKARALLYAQRLAAREPASPVALRGRAFVLALVGRPKDALDDLAAARKRPGGAVPGWVEVVEAACKGEPAGAGLKGGPDVGLAAMLRMIAANYPHPSGAAGLEARALLALEPDCPLAWDTLCRHGGISVLHLATEAGPASLSALLPAKLRAVGALPSSIKAALDRKADEPALLAAMAVPGEDAGEPSWAALAHLIREARFVQVARRLHFLRYEWAVPVADYWAEARPSVAGHRFFPYLEAMTLSPQRAARAMAILADSLGSADVELTAQPIIEAIGRAREAKTPEVQAAALSRGDDCVADLSARIEAVVEAEMPAASRALLEVDPRSAYARASLIDTDWASVAGSVAAWEEEAPGAWAVVDALGRHYTKVKEYDEAERYLARSIKLNPELWSCRMLAENYLAQGKVDRWKATLDEYIAKGDERGLGRSQVQVEVANHFIRQEDWTAARPYAEAASKTYSAAGLLTAMRVAEGAGEWEKAEDYAKRTTERYPSNMWMQWYFFCKRSGHGDAEAARAHAADYIAAAVAANRPDLADPTMVAFFHWLSGANDAAEKVFAANYRRNPRAATGIDLMILADGRGDPATRDARLAEVVAMTATSLEGEIYREFRAALDDPKHPLDVALIDRAVARFVPGARANLNFRVGMFLLKHGTVEQAKEHFRRCVAGPGYEWMTVFSADLLRKLDEKKAP